MPLSDAELDDWKQQVSEHGRSVSGEPLDRLFAQAREANALRARYEPNGQHNVNWEQSAKDWEAAYEDSRDEASALRARNKDLEKALRAETIDNLDVALGVAHARAVGEEEAQIAVAGMDSLDEIRALLTPDSRDAMRKGEKA